MSSSRAHTDYSLLCSAPTDLISNLGPGLATRIMPHARCHTSNSTLSVTPSFGPVLGCASAVMLGPRRGLQEKNEATVNPWSLRKPARFWGLVATRGEGSQLRVFPRVFEDLGSNRFENTTASTSVHTTTVCMSRYILIEQPAGPGCVTLRARDQTNGRKPSHNCRWQTHEVGCHHIQL